MAGLGSAQVGGKGTLARVSFFCAPLGPCGRLLAAGLRFFRSVQQKRKVSFLMSAFCLAVNFLS